MYSRTLRSMRSPTRVRGSRSAGLNSRVTAEGNKQRLGLGCLLHPLPSLVEPESTGRCKTDECVCFDMQVDHRHWCPSQVVGVCSCKCVARVRTRDERVSITWPASPRTLTPLSHLPLQLNVNHQRVCNPEMLGKLVHLGFDAILISAVLAGIKRSTGLTCVSPFPKLDARVVTKTYLRSHDRMQACINTGAEQGCSS
jgi:Mitofissin